LSNGTDEGTMNRSLWVVARTRWRGWAVLGFLLTIAFLAHDAGMASVAAHGEVQVVATTFTASQIRVVHVVDGTARYEGGSHHQHAVPADPQQSQCEIARAAIPTANDALDVTLHTIPSAVVPETEGDGALRPPWATDVAFRSSRDQRTLFQVFLI
jgi:hypothetical protein